MSPFFLTHGVYAADSCCVCVMQRTDMEFEIVVEDEGM